MEESLDAPGARSRHAHALDLGAGEERGPAPLGVGEIAHEHALLGAEGAAGQAERAAPAAVGVARRRRRRDLQAARGFLHKAVVPAVDLGPRRRDRELAFDEVPMLVQVRQGEGVAEPVARLPRLPDVLGQAPDDARVDHGGAAQTAALDDRDERAATRGLGPGVTEQALEGGPELVAELLGVHGRAFLDDRQGGPRVGQSARGRGPRGSGAHDDVVVDPGGLPTLLLSVEDHAETRGGAPARGNPSASRTRRSAP